MVNLVRFIGLTAFLQAVVLTAAASPNSFALQGQIVKPNGEVLEASSVEFTVQIYSPLPDKCLIYEEQFSSVNMAGSGGLFSLKVGTGSRGAGGYEDSSSLTDILNNRGGAITPTTCESGGPNYTPGSSDNRLLRLTFNDGSGAVTLADDHVVNSVPFAQFAKSVEGLGASDILQVNIGTAALSQANLENIFQAPTDVTELRALIDGTSSDYMLAAPTGSVGFNNQRVTDVATPTSANDAANKDYVDTNLGGNTLSTAPLGASETGEILTWNGTQWEAQSLSATGDVNNNGNTFTGLMTLGTNDNFGLNLETNGTPALSIDTSQGVSLAAGLGVTGGINAGGNVSLLTESALHFEDNAGGEYMGLKAPAVVTASTVLTLPDGDGAANQVLATDGSGQLIWATDSSAVDTVFGRAGTVVAAASDYDGVQVDNTPAGNIAATDVQAAINELDTEKLALAGGTMTGNLVTGAAATIQLTESAGTGELITIAPNADATAAYTLTLPVDAGGAGEVLQSNGSGVLSWVGIGGGGDFFKDGSVAMTGNLNLETQSALRLQDDAGGDYVALRAPTGVTSYTMDLPAVAGTVDQILKADASGNLLWSTDADTVFTPAASDYTAADVDNVAAGNIAATDAQAAINELDSEKLALAGGTMTGNLVTGAAATIQLTESAGTGELITIAPNADATAAYTLTLPVDDGALNEILRTDGSGNLSWVADADTVFTPAASDYTAADVDNLAAGNIAATDVQAAINELDTEKVDLAGDTMSGSLNLDNESEIQLSEADGSGADYVGFKAPATLAGNVIWTLPATIGTANQVLRNSATPGILEWANDTDTSAHSGLSGLTGSDDHTQYALLAGRAGGQSLIGGTAASEDLTIESSSHATKGDVLINPTGGNVGIGTTTPSTGLQIDSSSGGLLLKDSDSPGDFLANPFIEFQTSDGIVLGKIGDTTSGANGLEMVSSTGPARLATETLESIQFFTNSDLKMTIGATGDVGIGTASPNTKLHVEGAITSGPYGTGAGETGSLVMEELATNGTNTAGFRAPDLLASDLTWTLPDTLGTANQVLRNSNTPGILEWSTPATGTGDFLADGTINMTGNIRLNGNYLSNDGGNEGVHIDTDGNVGIGNLASTTAQLFTYTTDVSAHSLASYNQMAPNLAANYSGSSLAGSLNQFRHKESFDFLTRGTGADNTARTDSGTTGTWLEAVGSVNNVYHKSIASTITNAMGSSSLVENVSTGTITNAIGGHFGVLNTGGGTVTNSYGVVIDAVAGTNSWALYSSAAQDSYFAGSVGVGTTAPGTKLDVEGRITAGPIDASSGNTGSLVMEELAVNGINSVGLRAPDLLAADLLWTLPDSLGTANQVLRNSSTPGVLEWATPTTGTGDFLADGSVPMSGNITLGANYLSGDGGDEGIVVDATGRVGVGTSSPSVGLHVFTPNGSSPVAIVESAGTGSSEQATMSFRSDSVGSMDLGVFSSTNPTGGARGPNRAFITVPNSLLTIGALDATDGSIRFMTGGNSTSNIKTVIHPNGFVGMGGLAVPETQLHVTGRITSSPIDATSGNTGSIVFEELSTNGSNAVGLRAPDLLGADLLWTLPDSLGTANQVLRHSSTPGVLEWATPATGTGDFLADGTVPMTGDLNVGGQSLIGGTAASADLTLESTTNATKGDILLAPNGGNVGIGTTASASALTVYKSLASIDSLTTFGAQPFTLQSSYDLSSAGERRLEFTRTRGTVGAQTTVLNGDSIGATYFRAHDGTANRSAVAIEAEVDGVPGPSSMPGRLIFRTTPTGSATPVERARFTSTGAIGLGTDNPSSKLDVEGRITSGPIDATSGNSGSIVFEELAANGANTAGLRAPDLLAADLLWTLPDSLGTANQVLRNSSTPGLLEWATPSVGTGDFLADGSVAMTGDLNVGGQSVIGGTAASAALTLESTTHATKGNILINPSGGSVGIGTNTPRGTLSVNGGISGSNYSQADASELFVEANANPGNQNYGGSIILGEASGSSTVNRGGSIAAIQTSTDTNSIGLTFNVHGSSSLDPRTEAMRIDSDGNVGVGTTTPGAKLDVYDTSTTTSGIIVPRAGNFTGTNVNGMVRYNTTANLFEFRENGAWVNYTVVSDGRLKTNVTPVSDGLNIVNQLNPVFYDWDHGEPKASSFDDKHEVGFIAQEVEAVLPEVVNKGEDSYRSLEYGKIVSVVVAAVKELFQMVVGVQGEVEDLATKNVSQDMKIASQESKITSQESKIISLESKVATQSAENNELKLRLEKLEKLLEK